MKVYSLYEVVRELIREGGYSILDFRYLYDLMEKFRLQEFYAEGEIVEFDDEFSNRTQVYAEGEIVCGNAGIEIIGDMLIDYSE